MEQSKSNAAAGPFVLQGVFRLAAVLCYAYLGLLLTPLTTITGIYSLSNIVWLLLVLVGYPLLGLNLLVHKKLPPLGFTFACIALLIAAFMTNVVNNLDAQIIHDPFFRTLAKLVLASPVMVWVFSHLKAKSLSIFFACQVAVSLWLWQMSYVGANDGRPDVGFFGRDSNFIAACIAFCFPLGMHRLRSLVLAWPHGSRGQAMLGLKARMKSAMMMIAMISALLLFVWVVFYMQSRMAFLSICVVALIGIGGRRWPVPRMKLFALLFICMAVLIATEGEGLVDRLQHLNDTSNVDRIKTWQSGVISFAKAPMFGQGLVSQGPLFYANTGYGAWETDALSLMPHNSFLLVLGDLGLCGFLVVLFIWIMVGCSIAANRADPDLKFYSGCAFIALFCNAVILPFAYSDWLFLMLMLLYGLNRPSIPRASFP